MFPACNRTTGMNMHFPDVCKIPAPPLPFIPVPMPNMGPHAMAAPFAPTILAMMAPLLNMMSIVVMTTLDEAGVLGGLISGIIKGPSRANLGNPMVLIMFIPGLCMLCPTSGNVINAPLGAIVIPDLCITLLFTYDSPAAEDRGLNPAPAAMDERGQMLGWKKAQPLDDSALSELSAVAHRNGNAPGGVTLCVNEQHIGLLRIDVFESNVSRPVFNLFRAHSGKRLDGLVIDLRGNPGGDANAALDLADDFLAMDAVIAETWAGDDDREQILSRNDASYQMPVVICIDEKTCSAAEIFTASLQHHGRAIVVGSTSRGKTTAHRINRTSDGQAYYVPVMEYRRPDGSAIHERGVVPDIEAETDQEADIIARAFSMLAPTPTPLAG